MDNPQEIVYYRSASKGKGMSYAIVETEQLFRSGDIFNPSLRDFHAIFWFKKGSGSYYVDFQKYHFNAHTLVLLSKDQVHYFEPLRQSEVEIQSIVFNPEFIYRSDHDLRHLFQFTVATHIEGIQILSVDSKQSRIFKVISENMFEVFRLWNRTNGEHAFYHWLSLFLIHIEQLQSKTESEPLSQNTKSLLSFNQLLESNFRSEYKVEFYLNKMGITKKALSKLTNERYKLSPKAVINERRILEIKRQLKGTSKPIKNISYSLGFDEPTNMVKYFKRHTAMTPNGFRSGQL